MAVRTSIQYLERLALYKNEKPYMVAFNLPEAVGRSTNHRYIAHDVDVQDARDTSNQLSLDSNGFEFRIWHTQLQSTDFDDLGIIQNRYYPEVLQQMRDAFPIAQEIHILTHLRRKRSECFPGIESEEPSHPNPIVYAHTDFSPHGAEVAVERIIQENEHLRGCRFEIINLWRVTRGPNSDWPLAICDYASIDLKDVEVSDVVHRDKVGESMRLYHNPEHRWYYISEQNTSDVALFRNIDSRGLHIPFGMHLAFPTPGNRSDTSPRESIETRLVLFYSP